MRRQRKLTPAQRRVLRLITDNGYPRSYRTDGVICRKLVRRGYAMMAVIPAPWGGYYSAHVLTPKGLAALERASR